MTVHVDSISEIESVLAELRRGECEAAGGKGAPRVATMNFVVFVDDPQYRDWVVERAQRVADKHSARLLILDSTGTRHGIDASVSQRAGDPGGIGERIDVGVDTLDHTAIASLSSELTVRDIPTIVWWGGRRLLASKTLDGLSSFATEIVVDSSGSARDLQTIAELADFRLHHPNVIVNDLAFMRLAPWMDTIAQFFDDPAFFGEIFAIKSVRIESGSDAEALYLAGWLGSRLAWEALNSQMFRGKDRTVTLERVQRGEQRRVMRVVLSTDDSTYVAALSDDDESVVCLDVEGARARPRRCVPLHSIDNISLVEKAFLSSAHDRIFEDSLATVRDLLP